MNVVFLYGGVFIVAFVVTAAMMPVVRHVAIKFGILDHPNSAVKTHTSAVPYLGGVAIFLGYAVSLLFFRFVTDFPTGTLRTLRGVLAGSLIIFLLGLGDDIKPYGFHFKTKFLFQFFAAWLLLLFDVRLNFIQPVWFADILTVLWVIGVTNAMNLIDIMDGLAGGVAFMASLAFLVISLPYEAVYVNMAGAALSGAAIAFLPYNLSARRKIFMGDTGSLFMGFVLAALSLGTSYTKVNALAIFSPLLILGLPLYDTFLVMAIRLSQGRSPFLGSKDHFALRLEALGYSKRQVLVICLLVSLILSLGAYLATRLGTAGAAIMFAVIAALTAIFSWRISRIKMQ